MTPQQALQILDSVTAQVPLNRADHAKVVEALNVLLALVQKDVGMTQEEGK